MVAVNLFPSTVNAFQQELLGWFSTNARSFPWRETSDPFRVLVAEMLLQKTDAKKMLPVYEELFLRYPTPSKLAAAREAEVETLIAPIGLRYRAVRLRAVAEFAATHGLPNDEKTLLTIPGVGRYMARAVLCFAYGEPLGVLDSNVIRILDRVFGVQSKRKRPHTDPDLWAFADSLVPANDARNYNLGLLDLSAILCRPVRPHCENCPITECLYRVRGCQTKL